MEFLKKVTEVRNIIESEAAKLSAERVSKEEYVEIQKLCDRLEDILNNGVRFNYEKYLQVDMAFHTAILEASHNELLAQIGHTMRHAVQTARQADIHDIGILLASQPFYAAVMEATTRKDPESAYTASREMFDQVWKHRPGNHNSITKGENKINLNP
jgi:DNA-binding FadR family transcriptional regulator